MNILSLNLYSGKHNSISFTGKKNSKSNTPELVQTPYRDLCNRNTENLPAKFELTETEEAFNNHLAKLYRLNANIETQKQNLRDYYSAEDKMSYKELLKERRNLYSTMKRFAKRVGIDEGELTFAVSAKKEYNRYAPKIIRAKTLEDLKNIHNMIKNLVLTIASRRLLEGLIENCKKR